MEITSTHEALVTQITSLAWIRACLEVGITFLNKDTDRNEENELVIYESFIRQLDLFDVPNVKLGTKIIEKNIYEVIGNYLIHNRNPDLRRVLVSAPFMEAMNLKIKDIRSKNKP